MYVDHIELPAKASGRHQVMPCAEGADLCPPIWAHGRTIFRQAAAVQHLSSGTQPCHHAIVFAMTLDIQSMRRQPQQLFTGLSSGAVLLRGKGTVLPALQSS